MIIKQLKASSITILESLSKPNKYKNINFDDNDQAISFFQDYLDGQNKDWLQQAVSNKQQHAQEVCDVLKNPETLDKLVENIYTQAPGVLKALIGNKKALADMTRLKELLGNRDLQATLSFFQSLAQQQSIGAPKALAKIGRVIEDLAQPEDATPMRPRDSLEQFKKISTPELEAWRAMVYKLWLARNELGNLQSKINNAYKIYTQYAFLKPRPLEDILDDKILGLMHWQEKTMDDFVIDWSGDTQTALKSTQDLTRSLEPKSNPQAIEKLIQSYIKNGQELITQLTPHKDALNKSMFDLGLIRSSDEDLRTDFSGIVLCTESRRTQQEQQAWDSGWEEVQKQLDNLQGLIKNKRQSLGRKPIINKSKKQAWQKTDYRLKNIENRIEKILSSKIRLDKIQSQINQCRDKLQKPVEK